MKGRRILSSGAYRAFARDQRGAVAIMFAAALLPLTFLVGGTVDYGRAMAARNKLQAIADSAVLEGITLGAVETRRSAADFGKAATEDLFKKHAGALKDVSLKTVNVVVNHTSAQRDVTIEYTAAINNYFGTLLNNAATQLSGRATASIPFPFVDFFLMLDNSPSMGIGATLTDIQKMTSSSMACAFACHEAWKPDGGPNYAPIKNKTLDVKLRIDVVREATQMLLQEAIDHQDDRSRFRIAIYTFNMNVQEITPLTPNLSTAKARAENIALVPFPSPAHNDYRYTNFHGFLPYVNHLPNAGNGITANAPKSVIFLVSDGVADEHGNPRVKPIPTALCDKIKEKNFLIAVLYTTYHPLTGNHAYETEVKPIAPQIAPAMEQCASPGLYFEVAPGQGIAQAMQALFYKAMGEARLSK